ncbi:hypothetical protein AB0M02_29955 [Actinoplanes sp. NPDC051861]|uniref:hypothetical protein n=1 Tax=Actinoplanes sp. NPDC051861 TaxID=3155170 RepID=UPI003440A319
MDLEQLAGCFVVEIGIRQAWPFLGICDSRPAQARETRLYIDAEWAIELITRTTGGADDDRAWLTAAVVLNGRTVESARVEHDGCLRLATDSGHNLVISGQPQPYTVGEPWRISGWRPA